MGYVLVVAYVVCVMSVWSLDLVGIGTSSYLGLVDLVTIYYLLTTRLTGLDQYRNTSYSVDEPTARVHGYSL